MLLMSNLVGRQIALECLRVESRFINGQISYVCLGAERGALPLFYNKVIHRLIHRLCRGQGLTSLVINGHPRVLSMTAG